MDTFNLRPSNYFIPGQPEKKDEIASTALVPELDANDQYIQDMIDGNPDYADYSDSQKKSIFAWLKGQMTGSQVPMPDFLASAATLPGRELPSPSPLPTNPKPSATSPSVVPATKPVVGPKDVRANANAPDYMAQRYAGKTQDQMNTMFLNDAIKRRMGYSSGPMDEQLASWARANGQDESQFNAALNRHYAGAQANNPYAQVPKDQLKGRDQGMANAQRLLNAGLISSDQMPMVAQPTWSEDNAERLAGTPYTGFSDSRQRQMMEGVDAAYGAYEGAKDLYGRASDYVRSMMSGKNQSPMQKEGPFPWEPDYVDTNMFERGLRSLPVPVRSGTTFAPSQNVNDYIPRNVPVGRAMKDNPRMDPNYGLLNLSVPKIPADSQMVRPEIGKFIAPFYPEFEK